ncbi:uncharacterized protein LOC122266368 [Penaeus japonicus]|uniref:uncharacterized protein LOC122266368 n=1 Tax=Penaeus japonicus TaxID=27405 RepID=UPI001C70BEB6|nr:uncharacterized protein LOC122266368 [Penaeus japonicus]
MLKTMDLENDDILKEINPHLGFSYGKGVFFNRNIYDFPENEILDMCPNNVWNVKKAKNNMIILTFVDPEVPYNMNIEYERLSVRPLKPKPMQCYNCYKYGHPSKFCKEKKICSRCSSDEHKYEDCTNPPKCVNCGNTHSPLDKNCQEYKIEEAALNKAACEHITESPHPYPPSGSSLPSSSRTSDPSSEIKIPTCTEMTSQTESLPDLMGTEIPSAKRGRPVSLSPPPQTGPSTSSNPKPNQTSSDKPHKGTDPKQI